MTSYTIMADDTVADESGAATDAAEWADNTLTIVKNGVYSFAEDHAEVTIDSIILSGDALTEAVLIVPAPVQDMPGQGTFGQWAITWPEEITDRVSFSLRKRSTNSAILLSGEALSWDLPAGADFVLDVPLRVNQATGNNLAVNLTVRDGATMTFGQDAEIFADSSSMFRPSGYTSAAKASSYTVHSGGSLTVRNT